MPDNKRNADTEYCNSVRRRTYCCRSSSQERNRLDTCWRHNSCPLEHATFNSCIRSFLRQQTYHRETNNVVVMSILY